MFNDEEINSDQQDQYFDSNSCCRYYEPEYTSTLAAEFVDSVSCIHLNIRSARKNVDEFKIWLQNFKIDFSIIVLSETWLDGEGDWLGTEFRGYDAFHSIRENRKGGGVSILVDNKLNASSLSEFSVVNDIYESCAIGFRLENKNYSIIGVYRPPSSSIAVFNDVFFSSIGSASIIQSTSIIIGDFNIDLMRSDCHLKEEFVNSFNSVHFMPAISLPTRVTDNTGTVVDHIWTNSLAPYKAGIVRTTISDHFPIIFSLSSSKLKQDDVIVHKYRVYSEVNIANFQRKVEQFVECCESIVNFDLHSKVDIFCTALDGIFNQCFPIKLKRSTFKRFSNPWLNKSLLKVVDRKHYLDKESRAGRIDRNIYKRYRNITCMLIKQAKLSYYRNKFRNCLGDIKRTWKLINNIIKPTLRKNEFEDMCVERGIVDNVELADMWNRYFVSVGESIAGNVPLIDADPLQHVDHISNTFVLFPTTAAEICSTIKSLKNKPCNIQSIPNSIYKSVAGTISVVLSDYVNASFNSGTFPDSLKISRVIPLFKKGDKSVTSNYRPISTIHTISKIFEKTMHRRVFKFIKKYKLLSVDQFGFQRAVSTTDAVLKFTSNIYDSFDDRKNTISVYLDFQKAFDTLDHNILFSKLYKLGIRGCAHKWFRSYFQNRRQYVSVNNCCSSLLDITTGCIQGSIISPMLFLLYINDMGRCAPELNISHFADDTVVYASHRCLDTLTLTINNGLAKIAKWLKCNKLSLNTSKSNYTLFTNRTNLPPPHIVIDGEDVKRVECTKFLGLFIDEKLSFKQHIKSINSRVSRACGVVRRLSSIVPKDSIKFLYSSLVLPHVIFGVEVWGASSKTEIDALRRSQDRCIKLLRDEPVQPVEIVYYQNGLMPFDSIHRYFSLIKFYIYLHNENFFLLGKLNSMRIDHSHETRFHSNHNYNISSVRLSKTFQSFVYQSIQFWNNLNINMKLIECPHKFKRQLKAEILNSIS